MKIATLCYVRNSWKTLMMHRIKKENDMHEWKWNWLGWKMESWETPEECSIREIKEESWLDVIKQTLKWVITFPEFSKWETRYCYLFTIDKFKWELIEDCNEWELCWINNDKLLDLNLWDWDKIFLKWLDQDKFFSAKFNYKDWELLDYKVNFY
jgi:8-oxo-dGTP diphosphatase